MSAELPEHSPFLYGTAWKEDGTRRLTQMALKQGFRGIDTANQRKHYFEVAVGEGIADAMDQGLVTRVDIFVQTKFTHLHGQDERLPYDPKAPVSEDVQQYFCILAGTSADGLYRQSCPARADGAKRARRRRS